MLDISGKLIRTLRSNEFFGQGRHIVHVDAGQLNAGAYVVKVSSKGETIALPLMIGQ